LLDQLGSDFNKIWVEAGQIAKPLDAVGASFTVMGPALMTIGGALTTINAMGGIAGATGVLAAVAPFALLATSLASIAVSAYALKELGDRGTIPYLTRETLPYSPALPKYAAEAYKILNPTPTVGGTQTTWADAGNYDPATGLPYGNLHGRASGGPVSAGESYIVGEEGPEILSMGSRSGSIIPNGAINITVPVYLGKTKLGEAMAQNVRLSGAVR
jgi:hypothetical protein